MNVYDGKRISSMLIQHGLKHVENAADADVIILNTCSVREKASEKIFSALGRLEKIKSKRQKLTKRPVIMGIVGCVARESGANAFRRQRALNFVLGPQSYHKLPEILLDPETPYLDIDLSGLEKFNALPAVHESTAVGYVPIQEGCDHVCTYCIVPYTRGRELSRDMMDIMAEIEHLAHLGAMEICFLGQNVNGYRGPNGKTLADLIRETAKIPAIKRIWYTSSYPTEMTDELIAMHGTEPKLLPIVHLPLQSGSPAVLKRMNRPYDLNQYISIIEKLRAARSDLQISSDFIVGFPGETDDDFNETVNIVNKIGYINSFSFKYSKRPHTAAALMMDQIPENIKSVRLKTLDGILNEQQRAFNQSLIGKTFSCLIDQNGKLPNQVIARTPYMQPVILDNAKHLMGKLVNVKITSGNKSALRGDIIE